MNLRRTIYFTGRVQNVGFRATTKQIAQRFDVVGSVRNLEDGRVRIIVEGDPGEVDAFMNELRRQMGQYIKDESVTDDAPLNDCISFDIVY